MEVALNADEIQSAINKYGDIVLKKGKGNNIEILSIEEYKINEEKKRIEKSLAHSEQQIKEGKTIEASEAFKRMEEKYGAQFNQEKELSDAIKRARDDIKNGRVMDEKEFYNKLEEKYGIKI